jgi:hypothetical protein
LLPIKLVQRHRLLERKQVLVTPVAVQGASDLRLRPLAPLVPQLGQLERIALAAQDRANDGHARGPRYVTDHLGQLDIHLLQGLLHVLGMLPGIAD